MRIRLAISLLLLAFFTHARDPFFLQENRCQPPASDAAAGWRLLGVIGRPGHYQAWLRSPQGHMLHGKPGEVLAKTAWQVAHIDRLSASFSPSQDCPPTLRLALKGQHYAQDALTVAGTDQPNFTGAGAAVTGIR